MSCFYSGVVMVVYDEKAMDYSFKTLISNRFHDDLIALWIHSNEDENHYLDYLNTIDGHVRLDLLMRAESKNGLEFLDLRLRLKGCTQITVDVYSKPTNSFTYVDLLPL